MQSTEYQMTYGFYNDLIYRLSDVFPRFREENFGLFHVGHAFNDELPLMDVLIKHDLLRGKILKRSSSLAQPEIADAICGKMVENEIPVFRADTTYARHVPNVHHGAENIIFMDHGGYALGLSAESLQSQFVGITEHTLNGEEKLVQSFKNSSQRVPYLPVTRDDLKFRPDREVAHAIANQIIQNSKDLGKSIVSSNVDEQILLIGYGTMGMHIASGLRELGCQAEIIVQDISNKKKAFALQDGFMLSKDLESVIPIADFVVLATNVIKGTNPVLTSRQLEQLKNEACLISVTSMDDELSLDELIQSGEIVKQTHEGRNGVYKTQSGKTLFFMEDGSPANVALPDGGAGLAMPLIKGAGLAGAFVMAQNIEQCPLHLPEELSELTAQTWLTHYHSV